MLVSHPKISACSVPSGVGAGANVSEGVTSTSVGVAFGGIAVSVLAGTVAVIGIGERIMEVAVWIDGVRDGTRVGGLYGFVARGQPSQADRINETHAQQARTLMAKYRADPILSQRSDDE